VPPWNYNDLLDAAPHIRQNLDSSESGRKAVFHRIVVARRTRTWDDKDLTTVSTTQIAGITLIALGSLSFVASAAVGGGGSLAGSLLAGALNPLFFMGFPLGLYLLSDFHTNRGNRSVTRYYFRSRDGLTFGPYTQEQYLELESGGRILPESPVSTSPSGPWKLASELRSESATNSAVVGAERFFIQRDNIVLGPYTRQQFLELDSKGDILEDTPVSSNLDGPWKLAGELRAESILKS
jgi:hypothetical protein